MKSVTIKSAGRTGSVSKSKLQKVVSEVYTKNAGTKAAKESEFGFVPVIVTKKSSKGKKRA